MFEDRLGVSGPSQQTSSANQFLQVLSTMGYFRQRAMRVTIRLSQWKSPLRLVAE